MKRTEEETRPGSSYQFLDLSDAGQTEATALMGILYPVVTMSSDTLPRSLPPRLPPMMCTRSREDETKTVGMEQQQRQSTLKDSLQQQQQQHLRVLQQDLSASHLNGLNPNARAFDPVPVVFLPQPTAMIGGDGGSGGGGGGGGNGGIRSKARAPGKEFTERQEVMGPPPPPPSGMMLVPVRKYSLAAVPGRPPALPDQPPPPALLPSPAGGNVGFVARSASLLPAEGGAAAGRDLLLLRPASIVSTPPTSAAPPLPTFVNEANTSSVVIDREQVLASGEQWIGFAIQSTATSVVEGGGGGGGGAGITTSGGDGSGRNVDRDNGNQQMQQQTVSVANQHQQQMLPHVYAPMPTSAYIQQTPHGMYPVQMLPPTATPVPNNVFVGNLTANVSVHGYPTISPYLATTTPSGAYMPADVGAGPEMQLIPQAPVAIGGGQPQQHPPQQHTPELMHIEAAPPIMGGAGTQYGNLHGFYVFPPMAQHASGTPMFMAAPHMQMYYNAPLHGYHNVVYPSFIPPEYQMYDEGKGDDGGGPHGGQAPGPDDAVVHPGAAIWSQQPAMALDYHPDTGEYLPVHEDDGTGAVGGMLPQGPPPPQPTMSHHVLDPNVPGFTMQMAPAPISSMQPPEEFVLQSGPPPPQQQQSHAAGTSPQPPVEDYNGNGGIPEGSNSNAAMLSPVAATSEIVPHSIGAGAAQPQQPEDVMGGGTAGYVVGAAAPPQQPVPIEGSSEVMMVPEPVQQQQQGHQTPGVLPPTAAMDGSAGGAQSINNNFIVDAQYIQAHPPPPTHHVTMQLQQQQAAVQQPSPHYQHIPAPQGVAINVTDAPPSTTTNQPFQQMTQQTRPSIPSSIATAAGVHMLDANGNDTNNNNSANRKSDIITSPKLVDDAVVMPPSTVNVSTATSSHQQNEVTPTTATTATQGGAGSNDARKQSNSSHVPNQGFNQQQQQQHQPPILGYAAAVASQAPPKGRSEQPESVKSTQERIEKLSLKEQQEQRHAATPVGVVAGGGVNAQRNSSGPQLAGQHGNAGSSWVNSSGVGPKKGTASVSVSAIPNKEFPGSAAGAGVQQNKNASTVPLGGTVVISGSSSNTSTGGKQFPQTAGQKSYPDHNQRSASTVNSGSSSFASGTGGGSGTSSGQTGVAPPQMESKKVEAIPQRTVSTTAAVAAAPAATSVDMMKPHHQDVIIVPRPTTTATTSIPSNTNTVKSTTKAPVVINHPLNIPPPDYPLNIPPPIIVPPPQILPGGAPPQPNKTWASLFQTSSSSSSSSSAPAPSALSVSATATAATTVATTTLPASSVPTATSTSGILGQAAGQSGAVSVGSSTGTGSASLHHTPTTSSGINFAAPPSANRGPSMASGTPSTTGAGNPPSSTDSSASGAKKPVAKVQPYDRNHQTPSTPSAPMSYSSAAASTPSAANAPTTTAFTATGNANASTGRGKGAQQTAGGQKAAANASSTSTVIDQKDEFSLKFGDFLSGFTIDNTSISITPRGLINRSNYCYINTILQALIACPPFYHLMRTIRNLPAAKNSKHPKPFIDAMCALVNEFSQFPIRAKSQRSDKSKKDDIPEIQVDTPFEPTVIYKMLNGIRSDIFQIEGRQEDAEEFLGCVLNRLNDEMIEFMKFNKTDQGNLNGEEPTNGEVHGEEDADDWMVICGNRNKGTVTRTTDFGRSPISDIFRGKLRSRVQRDGVPPTYNIQPFFTLPLDIEKAASVKEALEQLVGRDELEGVTCSKTKQEVAAWQQVTLEELPVVLILHLKCFDYKMDGCTKILKTLDFPIELKIDSKLMSKGKSYSAKQKQYKLFAVVYHDGKEASKGHYITDVYHTGYASWIRYDDSIVKPVPEYNVLRPRAPRVPYLLYYRRMDTQSHGPNSDHRGGGDGGGGGGAGGGGGGGSGRGGSSHSAGGNDRHNAHHHGNDHQGRGTSGGGYGGVGSSYGNVHGNSGGNHYGSGGHGQGNHSGHYGGNSK
uniref:ubiquitinyl hydrolase 1 n=1 Tax=Anopheles epiroticus TaxID=199890 RepID=A0A182PDK1_9DIPT